MVLQNFEGSPVSLGTVNTKLGKVTSTSLGNLRGVNSLPTSGAISMSQCNYIQYGCRFYGSGYTYRIEPSASLDIGGFYNPGNRTNNQKMTLSYWIRIAATNASWRNIFIAAGSINAGDRRPSHWIIPSTRRIHSSHIAADGGTNLMYDSSYAIALTTWTHVCEVCENLTRKLYIDGVLRDTGTFTQNPANASNTYRVYVSLENPVDYRISLLRFYPYSFTDAQVTALYNSETALDKGI